MHGCRNTVQNSRMSLKAAREVCHLARLLRHSIDSYYEDELQRPTTLHCRQRREAKNALGQLRSAVQVTPYPQSIPGMNPKLVAHPGA
jgi:hypothetical protein